MLTVVPDLIEPLVAYRMWRYVIDERGQVHIGTMHGRDDTWLGASHRRWVTASCAPLDRPTVPMARHSVPNECCTCGFYSVKTIDDAEEILLVVRSWRRTGSSGSRSPGKSFPIGAVFGCVELAGKVIEHRLGYRAERARVLELIPLGEDDGTTGAVAQLLGVPTADALDVSRLDRELDRFEAECPAQEVGGRFRPPTLIERLRLLAHRRNLRILQGGAGGGWEGDTTPERS